MDLSQYRQSNLEQQRTEDLMNLIRHISYSEKNAIDIGARDGHFSVLLTEYFDDVTALDLEKPSISHGGITCVQGDITSLEFDDNTFDFVFCAEVLEHIPPHLLSKATSELSRVSRNFLLIGVPYKQDLRVGRTTCYSCGAKNPPWGHLNSFDEKRLTHLFPNCTVKKNRLWEKLLHRLILSRHSLWTWLETHTVHITRKKNVSIVVKSYKGHPREHCHRKYLRK